MLLPCKILLSFLYCSAAAKKQVTCANSERLWIKGRGWHLLLAVSLKGTCLKVGERYHDPWEACKISEENVGRGCSQVTALFLYAWQGKAAQRLKEEGIGLGEWGQERICRKRTLISHTSWALLELRVRYSPGAPRAEAGDHHRHLRWWFNKELHHDVDG